MCFFSNLTNSSKLFAPGLSELSKFLINMHVCASTQLNNMACFFSVLSTSFAKKIFNTSQYSSHDCDTIKWFHGSNHSSHCFFNQSFYVVATCFNQMSQKFLMVTLLRTHRSMEIECSQCASSQPLNSAPTHTQCVTAPCWENLNIRIQQLTW